MENVLWKRLWTCHKTDNRVMLNWHHSSSTLFYVTASNTLLATFPVFCELGGLCVLVQYTAFYIMFLLTIFKEGGGSIFFRLADSSTTSNVMFITC